MRISDFGLWRRKRLKTLFIAVREKEAKRKKIKSPIKIADKIIPYLDGFNKKSFSFNIEI